MASDWHVDLSFPWINREGQRDSLRLMVYPPFDMGRIPLKMHLQSFCRQGSTVPSPGTTWDVVSRRLQEKKKTNKISPLPKNPLVMNPGARHDLKPH